MRGDGLNKRSLSCAWRSIQKIASPIGYSFADVPVSTIKELVDILDDLIGNIGVEDDTIESPGSLGLALLPADAPSVHLIDVRETTVLLLGEVDCLRNQILEESGVFSVGAYSQLLLLCGLLLPTS